MFNLNEAVSQAPSIKAVLIDFEYYYTEELTALNGNDYKRVNADIVVDVTLNDNNTHKVLFQSGLDFLNGDFSTPSPKFEIYLGLDENSPLSLDETNQLTKIVNDWANAKFGDDFEHVAKDEL